MDVVLSLMSPGAFMLAVTVALVAGLVKGMVGFAMPMIMISGMSSFLSPELALAGLILPTFVTNALQAMRQGPRAAWESLKRFRLFLGVGLVFLLLSSQLVTVLSSKLLLALIGGPVTLFCLMQLLGWKPRLRNGPSVRVEAALGAVAGFLGGVSGVWGPPFVAYLTAINTEKREQMRVQGVAYGLGAVSLTGAHMVSGVFNAQTAWFSAALLVPAVIAMWLGGNIHNRIDQVLFRKLTLLVLLIAGLNLLRRAFFV